MHNLNPKEASQLLSDEFGIRRTPATLAKLRCIGGSAPFIKAGRAVLYPDALLRAWAGSLLSAPMNSTSEAQSRKGGAV